ncbi:hypothetical protein [Gracilibacillus lacisalsi]|uniref:hypothetical protein n=1 Tax=Gracilibacillus lacisalsi TaxID=393087 RepID=UPI00036842DE|nr:hypothetical protein [Gracilibacillus lacisalsi]
MPSRKDLDQATMKLVVDMEFYANNEGKDSPECKRAWRQLAKRKDLCGALMQKDGEYTACTRKPTDNSVEVHKTPRCHMHGGSAPAHDDLPEESKLAKLKNLRSDANFTTGLYATRGNFIESLSDAELSFMVEMEKRIRNTYEVPEDGISEVILEGMLHRSVIWWRLLDAGKLDRGSKHMADPLMDLAKQAKELGWLKKEQDHQVKSKSVLDKWLKKLDEPDFLSVPTEEDDEEDTPLN